MMSFIYTAFIIDVFLRVIVGWKVSARMNKSGTVHIKIAQVNIDELERKLERLEKENSMLFEKFGVWQYNAHKYGVSIDQLNDLLSMKN